ncbi:MAG: MBL fold metallo-hydrolase [Candidatus Tritonobacter lacicola]|nr:MBL fold metallo-hydrolase [Candidatus Tritonobacter lacicola]
MKIRFIGGVRSVTGSMHIIEADGAGILIDCGLFYGHREEANIRNRNLPFDAPAIEAAVLTHAHIDHAGNLPTLCNSGFTGPIYSTFATHDLCGILLRDSARIQLGDAEYLNRKAGRKGLPPIEPVYTGVEAERAMRQFIAIGYGRPIRITPAVTLTMMHAGHILGSAIAVFDISENGRHTRAVFTGDLGRERMPIIRSREPVDDVDVLIMESTYGDRLHPSPSNIERELTAIVNRTYSRGGKILIPAFSVGRTQQVVYILHQLAEAGAIPPLPIFVDSPLSVNATEIYRIHPECYNEETYNYLRVNKNPFGFRNISYIRKTGDSIKLNDHPHPCIIISASGMCEAGRILHHLRHGIGKEENTIVMVCFCAENTLGKRIVERKKRVRIFGEEYTLRAEVAVMNAFSAHADRSELVSYARSLSPSPGRTFLVHGDEDQSLALAEHLRAAGVGNVSVPMPGDKIET